MAYSGKFFPKNVKKYTGDPNKIFYRSLWERKMMVRFDTDDSILEWSSEEVVIPYISPVDKRIHRYFPDFLIKVKKIDGSLTKILIEVKPEKQTKPPEKKKRVTKGYINEIMTWGVNEAKWKAAQEFCLDKGWQFQIITENELGIK
jgi:hypothetical protein